MAKSIKPSDNTYWDSRGIVFKQSGENKKLSDMLEAIATYDMNETYTNGFYSFSTSTQNRPCDYGMLVVIARRKASNIFWVNQICFGTNGKIYFRQNINDLNLASWTQWKEIKFA